MTLLVEYFSTQTTNHLDNFAVGLDKQTTSKFPFHLELFFFFCLEKYATGFNYECKSLTYSLEEKVEAIKTYLDVT